MASPLEDFFEAAKAFCLWSESAPGTPDEEERAALQNCFSAVLAGTSTP